MATTSLWSASAGACRVWMRILGKRRSTGTQSTRAGRPVVSAAARRPAAPDAPWPTSSEDAYPRSRHARFVTETTTPVGVFCKCITAASSCSSATLGASETSTGSADSASAPAPGSTALGARHSLLGSRETATTSPSIARFSAPRPERRMSHPRASHAMEPSHGECREVRSVPWCRDPPARPAATAAGDKCSAKETNARRVLRFSGSFVFRLRLAWRVSEVSPEVSPRRLPGRARPRPAPRARRGPPDPRLRSSGPSRRLASRTRDRRRRRRLRLAPCADCAVVGQKHDAHLRHRPAVERAHDPYGSVVTVVGGLPGLGFDVRVSVVLVREHEEALRRVLAQRAQPLVARPAARSALLEHHAGHDDVRHARVRQQVHLVQRHVGVHHDVRRGVLREFPARGVGAAELRRRELAADVDVVAKVVLANNLHHAASLGLLHERTVVGRRHGVRLDARPSLVSPARERSNARTSRPRASAA